MKEPSTETGEHEQTVARLEARVARERAAREEAEVIAERSLRHLYANQERLKMLQRVAVTANEVTDFETTLQETLDAVCAHTGWPVGHVYLPAPEDPSRLASSDIWLVAQPEAFEQFRRLTKETTIQRGEGLPGRVLADAAPAWVPDITADPTFLRKADGLGVRGAFAFPVLVGEEVVAVLEFYSVQAEEPDDLLLETMAYVGAQLSRVVERERARRSLERYAAQLKERNAELEQFASIASHDLQEPLRMVSSFLQLLQRRYADQLDATADEYIEYAVDGAKRMQVLIQDLLAYSRVGTRGKAFKPVDMNRTVETVLTDLGPALEEVDADVEVEPLPTVSADETQMRQLLQNLVANAVKFSGEATPAVRVWAERVREEDRAAWRFAVSDNGIGIEAHHGDRVFQIFQRLHTRDEYEGTGIGLAVCKKIVERHGGRIWFESKSGTDYAGSGGTTFYFTLPLRPAPTQSDRVNG